MGKRLYKYVGPEYLNKVFGKDGFVTVKCSLPEDFNDPYELFLTVDFGEEPEVLALYQDVIGKIPQLPTTCFSRSPIVLPMWAHYAKNLQGAVIEIDEDILADKFPGSGFGDIDYQDAASEGLTDLLYRAYEIGKFRYFDWLNRGVFSAAYFTKATCWGYEQERRMLAGKDETYLVDDQILLDIPKECITALVCGSKASKETISSLQENAAKLDCDLYELRIGRSSITPYFVDASGVTFVSGDEGITRCTSACAGCKEPIPAGTDECSWCRINEDHAWDAMNRNSFRMLQHYGLLEKYLEGTEKIIRGET